MLMMVSARLTFEDTDQWREELRSMVCDETASLPSRFELMKTVKMKSLMRLSQKGVASHRMRWHSVSPMIYNFLLLKMKRKK